MSLASPRIRESVRLAPNEELTAPFGSNPFRTGTRVYLTNPEGKRVGFTFTPEAEGGILGTIWHPKFTADPGVYDELQVDNVFLRQKTDGTFVTYLGNVPFNPTQYTLITKDQTSYHYDQFAGLQSITDRNLNTLTYTDTGIYSSTGQSITWQRDALGRITTITDPDGNLLTYNYSESGDLESFTDQAGATTTYTYRTDHAHYLHSIIDARGITVSTAQYDAQGRVIGIADALGNATQPTYDLANNREVIADRMGHETTLVFDDRGNIVEEIDPHGHSILRIYDDAGNELTVTDERGFTTTNTYDARGNLLSVLNALGGVSTFTYNTGNQVLTATDALGRTTTAVYDAQGNLIQTTDATGQAQSFAYDSSGRVLLATDQLGYTTQFLYTGAGGQPNIVINPDGSTRSFAYNSFGQTKRLTDELGHQSTVVYNSVGLPIRTTDANGGITNFTYDATGHLLSLTDPVGNVTRYVYNAAGDVAQEIDPLGSSKFYSYNANGNLTELIDRNGEKIVYGYDVVGQRTSERWYSATDTLVRLIAYGYDENGNVISADDPDSHESFTYDALNRLTSASNAGTPDVPTVILSYNYDAVGNVISTTDNFGVTVASTYDDRNQLDSRNWSGGGIDPARIEFTYDARGLRTQADRFADATGVQPVGRSFYTYNDRFELTNLQHRDGQDTVLADNQNSFDVAGQLTREVYNGQTTDYGYDATGQLTLATRTNVTNESYAYDANGNRTNASYVTGTGNRLLSDGTYAYTYDAEGGLVARIEIATGNVTEYQYDHRQRLTAVTERSAGGIILQESHYTYDVFGRRIATLVDADGSGSQPAVRNVFAYEGHNIWADFDGNGLVTARYLLGTRLDELLARWRPGDGTAWYLTDHLGTVRDIANATGQIIDNIVYGSFGTILSESDPVRGDRFKFTARELNPESELYFYRARTFDPRTGRFLQTDPIRFQSGDANLYRYVGNGPASATDPSGQTASLEYFAVTASLAAISFGIVKAVCQEYGTPQPFRKEYTFGKFVVGRAFAAAEAGLIIPTLYSMLIDLTVCLAPGQPLPPPDPDSSGGDSGGDIVGGVS